MTGVAVPDLGQKSLVLTPHPLQRIGAFAVAALAGARTPDRVTPAGFDGVVDRMVEDLTAAARVPKGEPGWYLLGVSYLLWPNSAVNHPSNRKREPEEIRERIRAWRSPKPFEQRPQAPCSLCGRPSAGWYGKLDIPLGASVDQRNTTVAGHQGTPLCFPCVTCFHALPYACAAGGGLLSGVFSWDDNFLARATGREVQRNQGAIASAGGLARSGGSFAPEFGALRALRHWPYRVTDGVEVLAFSNNNQDQKIRSDRAEQPLAEWLRTTLRDGGRRAGFRHLSRAQATAKVGGLRMLAWRAFNHPERVASAGVAWLKDRSEDGVLPAATRELVPLIRSYITEVLLTMHEKDVGHVSSVAGRIATVVADGGTLKSFQVATRKPGDLRAWLKKEATAWTLDKQRQGAFVSTTEWRVLFDQGQTSWSARDLLYICVLEYLAARDTVIAVGEDEEFEDADFTTLDQEEN
ncbi:hypothetical protein ACFVX9_16580 [Kitasatospora sp. NPDC058243]|uniref:hypothetical protein n=1 Tax=Kitasatospora sp. NPDC058243 TaxID=3346397 RepID=UPI0036DCD34B